MLSLDLGDGLTLAPLEPWQAAEFAAFVAAERDHLAPGCPGAAPSRTRSRRAASCSGTPTAPPPTAGASTPCASTAGWSAGRCSASSSRTPGICEVGVWLAADAQGHGYVTRAVTAMLDWACCERGLHRAEWHCVPENPASRAVAERLGMTHEGTLRESWEHAGRMWDTEVWARARAGVASPADYLSL